MPRKKKEAEEIRGDEWLATFSDTITLLLTFFVLLYSFSTVDNKKLQEISSALQSVLTGKTADSIMEFNMQLGEVPVIGESSETSVAPVDKGKVADDMYEKVKDYVKKNNLEAVIAVGRERRGIDLQLRDNVLFESGSASLKDNSKPILDLISNLLDTFPGNDISVEGHTDNVPIKTAKYESNWELSTSRASTVLRYLVEVKAQNPTRFQASGYGEYKPIVPNDTPEHRAMNRRVQILILTKETGETISE